MYNQKPITKEIFYFSKSESLKNFQERNRIKCRLTFKNHILNKELFVKFKQNFIEYLKVFIKHLILERKNPH